MRGKVGWQQWNRDERIGVILGRSWGRKIMWGEM